MGYSSSHQVSKAQEVLYTCLLADVKRLEPEQVLEEFKQLFIYQVEVRDPLALKAIIAIVKANDRQTFFYTLKRCCFILINNWGSARVYEPIHQLIATINDAAIYQFTYSKGLKRLRTWLINFVKSKEYENLKLFAERYSDGKGRWSQRYASYLLVAQYGDERNPAEQRAAARLLSRQLRDRFRLDLAMYVAHSQVNPRAASGTETDLAVRQSAKNPTNLGDNVLRLIKMIVLRRGQYSYENLAQFFLSQTEGVTYKEYKNALLRYLVFSVDNKGFVQIFLKRLSEKLDTLYEEHDSDRVDDELVFRTCNQVIKFLTTEDNETPTPLFNLLISQGGPLTLVVVLLKLILVAPNTRNRLEYCIAKLIQHYEEYSSDDCHWFINFLEVFTVTFAIYVEDVQYNLVRISSEGGTSGQGRSRSQDLAKLLDDYRIFSQARTRGKHDGGTQGGDGTNGTADTVQDEAMLAQKTAEKVAQIQSKLHRLAHPPQASPAKVLPGSPPPRRAGTMGAAPLNAGSANIAPVDTRSANEDANGYLKP